MIDQAPMIRCQALTKRYGDFTALRDCSLTVPEGSVFGLLGPNGAGKTTLIRLMLGYLTPSAGQCHIGGIDAIADSVSARRRVSYLPGDARMPRHMRGRAALKFFAQLHRDGDLDRSLAVAERLELDLRTRVAFMSTGMRQKLALAVVLGPRTPLLILDEPTANLDPTVRGEVLTSVREAQGEGRTVLLSSHVLSEIEETCDQVIFLRRGIKAHQLKLSELHQAHRIVGTVDPTTAASLEQSPKSAIPESIREQTHLLQVNRENDPTRLVMEVRGDLAPLVDWLATLNLRQMRIEPLGLRSVYDAVHFQRKLPLAAVPRANDSARQYAGKDD